jgi:plasmid stabilization system protein ParE
MRVIWSPLALERVAEIAAYIGEDRPQAAEHWVEETFDAVKSLSTFPSSGRIVPELNREDVREVFHGAYRILYRVEAAQLSVLTVRHSRQLIDPDELTAPEPPA